MLLLLVLCPHIRITNSISPSSCHVIVQILLGWDRPVYGKIAALQLLNMKENIEKTAPSATHMEAYGQYVPKVLSCLNTALGVETEREGKRVVKSVIFSGRFVNLFA
jgi:hypothetical protein